MSDRLLDRLYLVNVLTHALDVLQARPPVVAPGDVGAALLERELFLVLEHARAFAGLNPDGTFDQVPRKTNAGNRLTPSSSSRPPRKGGAT